MAEDEKALAMFDLMDSFPAMKAQRFVAQDPAALHAWGTSGASSGEKMIISFLLHVWNQHEDWNLPRFDPVEAHGRLSSGNWAASAAWAREPFTC